MSAVENVARKGAGKQAMKMVTLYLSDRQYQRFQMQAERQGRKAAERHCHGGVLHSERSIAHHHGKRKRLRAVRGA